MLGAAVLAGEPLVQTAQATRIPRVLTDLLAGARMDVPGAARFAARAYAAVSERYILMLRAMTPLLLTLVFAVITASLALSLFQPFARLIDLLAYKVAA